MIKRFYILLLAIVASVGMSWATENSIVINGTPQVGDNSISLTYYFDPANVPGIDNYAPTLKVKCVTDNNWDEMWLNLHEISSGTENITLETLGSFQAGKEYAVCYAYFNGSWVDEVFQSFSFPDAPAPTPAATDLASITGNYTAQDGEILTGTLGVNVQISIAPGATVTLSNVNINGDNTWTGGDYAGITCPGDATIILADGTVNKIRGFLNGNAALHIKPGYTLTIEGNGTLYASTNGGASAIGCGYSAQGGSRDGGNIVINGGTIYATGGNLGSGIGGGGRAKIGNITINGGIIFATGGGTGAGIGGGQSKNSGWKSECGNITISSSVKYLKATKGSGAEHSIGKGSSSYSVCGTLSVGGNTTGLISTSPYIYCPPADAVEVLIDAIGTLAYTPECKAKIDAARAAYDALEIQEMKDAVENYATLTAAEEAYASATDEIALINAIPNPVEYTDACKEAIDAARAAYDAMTEAGKALVTNYATLTAAESKYAVDKTKALINALPDTPLADEDKKLSEYNKVTDAREAYDALSAEDKAAVPAEMLAKLEAVEAAFAAISGGTPAGALNGAFTINEEGDRILFSKGNLQATTTDLGANWTWSFADKQWNTIGNAVANTAISGNGKVSQNGTVDLFGWSTTANYYGIHNSDNTSDYAGDFVDWGATMGAGWRTLTSDEWNHLLSNRTMQSSAIRYVNSTVNNIKGLIILPDDWNESYYTLTGSYFDDNIISAADWTDKLEAHGAVFLPVTGFRSGTNWNSDEGGYYSTPTINTSYSEFIQHMNFNEYGVSPAMVMSVYNGLSVRLVTAGAASPLADAQAVKDLIDAIPQPVVYTPECKEAIKAAREALDALGDEAKALFAEADTAALPAAEATYAGLLAEKVAPVIAAIDAIPSPIEDNLKLSAYNKVTDARALYDALTDEEKAAVDNYDKLTAAEAAFAAISGGDAVIVWSTETLGTTFEIGQNTTSEPKFGITLTTGAWRYFTTYEGNVLRFGFNTASNNNGFTFTNTSGSNFTKIVVSLNGTQDKELTYFETPGWTLNTTNRTLTWEGDASNVSIWDNLTEMVGDVNVDFVQFTIPGASSPLADAQAVKDLIDAIPQPVVYTPECSAAIKAAREAVNALGENASLLDDADLQKLTDAEAAYADLLAEKVAPVIAAIDAVPATPLTPENTKLSEYNKVTDARALYDALTDEEKAAVDNYDKLTAAEAAFAAVGGGGGSAPAGALNGKFSINGSSVVYFSKGNLQATYDGSAWSWAFAANQWDYVGNAAANTMINGNGTVSENGTVDLFGWVGASSEFVGLAQYGITTSEATDATDGYGNNASEALKSDWGTTMGEGWFTLSTEQWQYLFNTRLTGTTVNGIANARYTEATINSDAVTPVNGIILFPENASLTSVTGVTWGAINETSGWETTCTTAGWTALEEAGCVFLPAAGRRYVTSVFNAGSSGYYWSSSPDPSNVKSAYDVFFRSAEVNPANYNFRSYGYSVRLVTEALASPLADAQAAKDLIDAIPQPVVYTPECKEAIKAAREALDALSDEAKALFTEADTAALPAAEATYAGMLAEKVAPVIAAIDAVPATPLTPENTKLSEYNKVTDARALYDALATDEEKAAVTNYDKLTAAEAAFAAISGGDAGALSGKFSIDESSVVYFSKGNLQATTADLGQNWTWSFAAHQYDVIGNAAANNAISGNGTVSANGTVDLFGWSTSTTFYGIHNSTDNGTYYASFVDWSSNTDLKASLGEDWRTLTSSELEYLLNTRTTTSGVRYAKATVNSVAGLIILPDNWDEAYHALASTNNPDVDFNGNIISSDEWTNELEAHGAVFLPAAGNRNGTNVSEAGSAGYYWSATSVDAYTANYMYFNNSELSANSFNLLYYGRSVRLVTENAPASPLADAQAVKDLIDAIPSPVVYTPECSAAIKAAREALDALSDEAKTLFNEADTAALPAAEATYAVLLAEKVAPVIAAIDAVPATPLTDATKKLSEYNKVTDARALYNALTDEEKAAVDNYDKLTAAEAAFAAIPSVGSETVITWDKNTGIEKISGTTTSPAYEGITISIKGGGFGPQDDMLRFNIAGLGLSFEFANTLGGNFQKIVISSTNAMPSTPLAGMGEGWAASNENKTATWTGDAANVKIWDDLTATSYWDVNTIQFTLGETVSATEAAQAAVDKINAIPSPVVLSDECNAAIKAAREAVTALGENASLIDDADLQKLTDAEAALTALNQAVADEVIAKINNIPLPVELKLATRDSIESARAAYDALTADQQALVTNYQTLLDAEEALAGLNPGGGMPADALNGKFTINAGGDQISFAKGNLQATTEDLGANWTWGFAANQWDYLGIAVANSKINGNGTVSENGTVDLFGWSTAATYYGINNSYKAVDYIGDFVDWGPKMGAGWRTLTKDEWAYLLQHSSNGKATVNDKNGYIFLPDNWSGPAFTPDPDNFTTNVYSGDDWTAMENAGAVFLPSGPARNGVYALIANDAKYSSSTSLNNDTSYVFTIYYNQSQSACTGTNRAYGCMVRLVTEGGGATPLDSAQAVKDLIEAIPVPVTLDDACVNAIEAARAAYDALSEAAQGALDAPTVQKLTDAEAALTGLNQAVADEVIAKINNIPLPVELKLATRDSIESARAAYDALNAAQQALVTNYQKLTDAEAALAELNKGGSASVDIVWDINTGIETVNVGTTSPAYEGITITTGNGNRFYQTTQDPIMLRFFFTGGVGSYAFAKEDGSHFTKVVLISSVEMSDWMINPSRIGTDWVVSDENKKATWIGDADTVKIWDGVGATSWVDVDSIVFTVSGSATPLDSAQAVKDLIDAIPTPVEYPTSGPAIAAALVAYNQLSDAAKGALDDADVQKMTDAAAQYAALDAIAAIEAIPAEIVYDPAVKAAIENARDKYDALIDASKALIDDEVVAKLTNAEQAWADLVALIEHNVSYIGKDGELKHETVALLNIPNPAPDFNGYEFVRWDVKAGDFLEEGLRIKAVYTPIITTNPVAYDSLMYNGTAQTLITAGVAKEGHIEYRLNDGEWSTELPKATFAAAYVVYYKLVREGHADYIADSIVAIIAKAPVVYTAPAAVDTLVYTAANQTLIAAGQTNDGTFEYSLDPTLLDSWKTALPQAMAAGTYNVFYRVQGDLNHLDSVAATPVAVTIAKAELTATADDKNVIYGDAVPEYSVTYAGWQGDDDATVLTGDIAFACDYNDTTSVGTYPIVPSGVGAADYTISFVNGKVTVAKAESGCIAPVVYDTLVYNGANQTLIIAGQPMGGEMQYSLDTTVLDCWSTSLPQAKDAGTHNVYYRVKGDKNHNDHYYDLITVSIAKAALTATADDKNVVYGDSVPEYTVSYSGWMGTDESSVLTGTIAFACTYAPTSNVGEYTITPSGVDAANYIITFVNGKVTVAKADLMITADDKNVIYGEVAPAFTASYSGWKNSDDASVVSGLTLTSEYLVTSNVGTYDIVPANASATNYAISYTNGTLTVAKAALTITANDTTMIYGDEHPEFTVTYAGWKNTDDESVVSGLQFSTPYAPGSPIGTYAINPNSATAENYQITFVDGKLTVNKATVYVSGAEAHPAKFADGHANAEVTKQGTLNGVKLNDPIAHVTTAAFSSADVAENLTITLFYELTGDAALLNNYFLTPTSEIFSTEGVIIEPFIPNDDHQPEEGEQVEVKEGIDVYAYGYCDGSGYSLKYHLNSGNPDQYKIEFEDSRFTDIDWTNLTNAGKDGTIDIEIPVDLPTGDYSMTVYFRDSRFDWLESQALTVSFHVNLPETYVRPLFDNVIALVDTCHCLTDIQWYWRANSTDTWQPIEGANGYYYHTEGKLTGEYFVKAKMNGMDTYTCGQSDMETLYGESTKQQAQVKAYPNPVNDKTNVTIEGSELWIHNLRIVNLMGVEMQNSSFEGNETTVEMGTYPMGNYMISVDGIVVKVMKQ